MSIGKAFEKGTIPCQAYAWLDRNELVSAWYLLHSELKTNTN